MREFSIQTTLVFILIFFVIDYSLVFLGLSSTVAGITAFLVIAGLIIYKHRHPEFSSRLPSLRRIRLIIERERIKKKLNQLEKEEGRQRFKVN